MAIEDYVPKMASGIDGIGFIFGAGTSFESGYPLVAGLTRTVVGQLSSSERTTLDEVLTSFSLSYDDTMAEPNIEIISDCVVQHYTNSQAARFGSLADKIKSLVTATILGVASPDLSSHVAFLKALTTRALDRPASVWVFTTNYDLLFEEAAAEVGVRIINGFSGVTKRFYSEKEFHQHSGALEGVRFKPENNLTIRLVKLHGSVSWYKDGSRIFENHPMQLSSTAERCMILPRRSKVFETLSSPYDRLFRLTSEVIGRQCMNLIGCGFSFNDDHINETLFLPKINTGEILLANFCENDPPTLAGVRSRRNVLHICKNKIIQAGRETANTSEEWKFSEFVKQF